MTYQEFHARSLASPEQFWGEQAKLVNWFKFPENILSKDEHKLYRWYQDGILNTSYLALDRHVAEGRGDQAALIYDSPVTNSQKTYTYQELLQAVELFAGVLKGQQVQKGDTVIIYMPMIPEAVIAMLACARLGAIHSVVFGGFAAHELAIRVDDAKPKILLTASCGIEFTKVIDYMTIINEALEEAVFQPSSVIVCQRKQYQAPLKSGRDYDWETLLQSAKPADYVPLDAGHPLYIIYTSGTTSTPKGIVRENGGHAVAMQFSMKYIYGIEPGEVFWAASDVGWVVGHSYIVYGPLLTGATTILYEGKPIKTPDAGAFWRVIEQYEVKVFFTAPTAIRAIKKEDPDGLLKQNYDTACLRYLFLAGERCDVATLEWSKSVLNIPVIDHWWQTESGWPMLANMVNVELLPVKPGSATKPVPGFDIRVVDSEGENMPPNQEGAVVVRLPLPPGCLSTLWNDTDRFIKSYLAAYPGYYFSGDGGYIDEDGYIFITGRIDDVINVAGHRLSTSEMEEIVAAHPAVAECAVIGVKEELKGQVPVGFVVLKSNSNIAESDLEKDLIDMVRHQIGPIACFKKVMLVPRLPKTRSGKILRKIMRHIADGEQYTTPSTIEDVTVLNELTGIMADMKVQ